mgnify:CR=1 FL=1
MLVRLDALTLAQILGFSIGFLYGESFRRWDYMIKYKTRWYRRLSPWWRWFISSLLDTQHHFQYGLALMLLTEILEWNPLVEIVLYWLGLGLVLSDWKDYRRVLKRMGLVREG